MTELAADEAVCACCEEPQTGYASRHPFDPHNSERWRYRGGGQWNCPFCYTVCRSADQYGLPSGHIRAEWHHRMMFEVDIERFVEDGVLHDTRSHQYRFPIVGSAYPRWCYITAVVVGELWGGVAPTDDELRIVASFHDEYVSRWYNPSYTAEMLRKYPFDVDGSANGRLLIKRDNGGWAYRHASWQDGPTFVPSWDDQPISLLQVLDREQSFGSKPSASWELWKTTHPEVFHVS